MNYKKLYAFDFDSTLFFTPDKDDGEKIWKEKTGIDWPYVGWWGKSESIDPEIFNIELNPWVYKKYLDAISDNNAYVILATGRLQKSDKMQYNIDRILSNNNISFDEVHLNWGGDTYNFKTRLFEGLIKKTKCDEFIMYDDRHEHIVRFKEWAKDQNCKITIVDVINKKESIFNK